MLPRDVVAIEVECGLARNDAATQIELGGLGVVFGIVLFGVRFNDGLRRHGVRDVRTANARRSYD